MNAPAIILFAFFTMFGIATLLNPIYTLLFMARFVKLLIKITGQEEDTKEYMQQSYGLLFSDPQAFRKRHDIALIFVRIIGLTILGMVITFVIFLFGKNE